MAHSDKDGFKASIFKAKASDLRGQAKNERPTQTLQKIRNIGLKDQS